MSTITFDTLKFVQRLEKAGVSRELAIAKAEALKEALPIQSQSVATSSDIQELRDEIRMLKQATRHLIGLSFFAMFVVTALICLS